MGKSFFEDMSIKYIKWWEYLILLFYPKKKALEWHIRREDDITYTYKVMKGHYYILKEESPYDRT